MLEELRNALRDFADGHVTKGGFTDLELWLARVKDEENFDSDHFDQILATVVQDSNADHEDVAMGIALTAKRTGCYGTALRDALERRLFDMPAPVTLSARSQYELSNLLIKCGGEFAPQQLHELTVLKSESPALWLDLALEAYAHDQQGLLDTISSMISGKSPSIKWTFLKPRYLKLISAIPNNKFNNFALNLAKKLPPREGAHFLTWINEKRGTQLSLKKSRPLKRASRRRILDDTALDFISGTPLLAEAAA
ncbi:hypothetical protein J7426_06525 [Tropicibacter sp. R16_0]|uniref:hypothetical protein n=1 Tax=Tropicibacter sp. R16_0 TaxID=2821102 RepID=UPI001ADA01FB|nr:hypothetical protein [Tropicibacter sp. R16_0]MBO9449903.1 hypothetical protein [Tropicibacter sp. R16_0]